MTKNKLILIADGSRARLLSQDQSGHLVELQSWDSQRSRQEPHEVESDRSGQAGPGKTFEHSDPQRRAKFLFASRVAKDMKEKISSFDHLILVAAPKTLGDLRTELDDQILAKVEMQIDRDWTHISLHDLPEHLEKAVSAKR